MEGVEFEVLDSNQKVIYANLKTDKNGEIVLTSNDYNGVTLMSIEDSEYFEL